MEQALQITFRDFASSPGLEDNIRQRAQKLERFHEHIVGCHVMVESQHHHHRKGRLFHVRIEVTVPTGEIVVSHDAHDQHAHEDVYVALRDAFDAARRQLDEHAHRLRGEVKHHP